MKLGIISDTHDQIDRIRLSLSSGRRKWNWSIILEISAALSRFHCSLSFPAI